MPVNTLYMTTRARKDGSTFELFSISFDTSTCEKVDELRKADSNRSRSAYIEKLIISDYNKKFETKPKKRLKK